MDSPRRTGYLGVAFLLGVVAVLAVGLIVVLSEQVQQGARDTAITQAHTLADPILQLCDQGGDVAQRLTAKGLCGTAAVVHSEPLGAATTAGVTPEQVEAMIRADEARRPVPVVTPQQPQQPAVVPQVVPVRPNVVEPNVAPAPPPTDYQRQIEQPRTVTPREQPYSGPRGYRRESTPPRRYSPQPDNSNYQNDRQRPQRQQPDQTPYQQQYQQPQYQQQRPYQQPNQQQPYQQPAAPAQQPPANPAPRQQQQPQQQQGLLSNLVNHLF